MMHEAVEDIDPDIQDAESTGLESTESGAREVLEKPTQQPVRSLLELKQLQAAGLKAKDSLAGSPEQAEVSASLDHVHIEITQLEEKYVAKMTEYMKLMEHASRETMIIKVPIDNESGSSELFPVYLSVARLGPENTSGDRQIEIALNLTGSGGLTITGGGKRTQEVHAGGFALKSGALDESSQAIAMRAAVEAVDRERQGLEVPQVYVIEPFLLESLPAGKQGKPSTEQDVLVKMKALKTFVTEQRLHQDQGSKKLDPATNVTILAGSAGAAEVPWVITHILAQKDEDEDSLFHQIKPENIRATMLNLLGVSDMAPVDGESQQTDYNDKELRAGSVKKLAKAFFKNFRRSMFSQSTHELDGKLIKELDGSVGISPKSWDEVIPPSIPEVLKNTFSKSSEKEEKPHSFGGMMRGARAMFEGVKRSLPYAIGDIHEGIAFHQTIGRYLYGVLRRFDTSRGIEGLAKLATRQDAWDTVPPGVQLELMIPAEDNVLRVSKKVEKVSSGTEQVTESSVASVLTAESIASFAETAFKTSVPDTHLLTGPQYDELKALFPTIAPSNIKIAVAEGPIAGTHAHSTSSGLKEMYAWLGDVFSHAQSSKHEPTTTTEQS